MDGELERYHKNNATLDLTIGDFKLKQNGLQKEVVRQRSAMQDGEQLIRSAWEGAPAIKLLQAMLDLHHVRGHLQMKAPEAKLSSSRPEWRLPHKAPGRPCSKLSQAFLRRFCRLFQCSIGEVLHPDAVALEFDCSSLLKGALGIWEQQCPARMHTASPARASIAPSGPALGACRGAASLCCVLLLQYLCLEALAGLLSVATSQTLLSSVAQLPTIPVHCRQSSTT